MTRMRRTENVAWIRPTEVFYDGVLPVRENEVEIPRGKEHWELQLVLRGWEKIDEEPAKVPVDNEPTQAEEKSATTSKRKVANAKNSK